ncbi:MAG TPA: RNA polymerase sigma factor [Pyrinomonadaceae bacterium]|nr:RNA polymerase sigma factor [Pyrinomonadaceae bacterium]
MLDQRRAASRPEEKREQLFTERYESLLAWALRLTNQQREAAQDLVQDAFVQFMLGRTGLEQIENIDGYLRRMLRYMYVSRMSRQAQRLHDTALSVADYDSFSLGWTAIEPPRRMQALEELQQICAYACARKESSRAGSVLILRFFHDYFPTEIAGIVAASRHCVDQWQRLARREVKVFMNEPGRLRFVNARRVAEQTEIKSAASGGDLMTELREMIFHSCQGECPSPEELRDIYSSGNSEALTTAKLAHIVSCRTCLDKVNVLLGLPLLDQRYRPEPPDQDPPPFDDGSGGASGGGASGGDSGELRKKLGRRLREISEHKPQELRIAVNGVVVSSLKISSDQSELDLNLNANDPVEFIEIFSEQDVQLLFLSSGTGSEAEQWAWIALSEGRTLAAFLRLQSGPSLRVVYKNPSPEELASSEKALGVKNLSSPLALVQTAGETIAPNVAARRETDLLRSWTRGFLSLFRRAAVDPGTTEEATGDSGDRRLSMFSGQLAHADRRRLWTRPGFVTALLIALLAVGFVIWTQRPEPTLTANSLLNEADVAEQKTRDRRDQVSHRVTHLEERRSAEGAVVSRQRIETWQNHATGEQVQRLYDESNVLVAGMWQKPDGSRVVYHHGTKPQPQSAPASSADLLVSPDDIWQLDPSAKTFRSLIAETAAAHVEQRSASYVLRFEQERAIGASRLLKATLTLNQSDLRSVEQTLLVQRGGELREYRFVEASFELVPTRAVDKKVFEVEPELKGGARLIGKTGDWAHRDFDSSRVPPSSSTLTPAVASAELEVDVAYLLNQAKADRNEQVTLTRSAGGSLRVEGLVDDEQRKSELLRALAPVSQNPAVAIDIRTIAEALQRTTVSGPVSIRQAEQAASTIAVDAELREYFSRRDQGGNVDESIRSFSSRVVNRAYRAVFHAISLERVVNRFANVDMRTVTPDARAKWLAMVREHASAYEREMATLREELRPIFFAGASSGVVDEKAIANDADLAVAVERLRKLALTNNDAVRTAFTISARSSGQALKSSFWSLSASAEGLAQRIQRYAQ